MIKPNIVIMCLRRKCCVCDAAVPWWAYEECARLSVLCVLRVILSGRVSMSYFSLTLSWLDNSHHCKHTCISIHQPNTLSNQASVPGGNGPLVKSHRLIALFHNYMPLTSIKMSSMPCQAYKLWIQPSLSLSYPLSLHVFPLPRPPFSRINLANC